MLAAAGILGNSCKKDEQVPVPVIHATVSPGAGNTTQTFMFDMSKSESQTGRGAKLFTRWDWNGDGKWDTPFTRMLQYEHRFYAPGTWYPKLEMTNLDGGTDSLRLSITVTRGYSAPRPVVKIVPAEGHIYTSFLLDASATHDDEDSLDQLDFRWDFEGDGVWDTSYGDSTKIHHTYPETGFYQPGFQVRDPKGLVTQGRLKVNVSMKDPRLLVSFRCIPDSVTDHTPIMMDASASIDQGFPDRPMSYRWDWDNDRVWDTEWLNDPKTVHVFLKEYMHYVRLEVRSFRGLTNETVLLLRVFHKNRPPLASFSVSSLTGNLKSQFRFDCWSTRDAESSPSQMTYRWDFDGDDNWDTGFSENIITMHQYDKTGIFRTVLQVKDPLGELDTISKVIYITNGTNPTEIFEDRRGTATEYYGTVRIGDQWWFTRNMVDTDTFKYYLDPFENNWPEYFDYGGLFSYGKAAGNCPYGWRLPSKADWNKLFSNYPEENLYDALVQGGESDFGANLGGMGIGTIPNTAVFNGKDRFGYYWASTKPADGSSTSIWVITLIKANRKVLWGFYDYPQKLYSLRCVRDAN